MPKTVVENSNSSILEKYGPWAVIAGASEGTGAEFARQLAGAGFNLMLVARRQEPLDQLADELRRSNGVEVSTLSLDLMREDAAQEMFLAANDIEVGLYISNAGSDAVAGTIMSRPLEKALAIINLNVRTVTSASYLFLGPMCKRGRGGVVLMSSVSGLVGGQPGSGMYSATKAFDLALAESLWSELRADKVDVIGIGAPPMATPIALSTLEMLGATWDGLYEPAEVVRVSLAKLGLQPSYIFDFVGVETEPGEVTATKRHTRMKSVEAMIAKVFGSK